MLRQLVETTCRICSKNLSRQLVVVTLTYKLVSNFLFILLVLSSIKKNDLKTILCYLVSDNTTTTNKYYRQIVIIIHKPECSIQAGVATQCSTRIFKFQII